MSVFVPVHAPLKYLFGAALVLYSGWFLANLVQESLVMNGVADATVGVLLNALANPDYVETSVLLALAFFVTFYADWKGTASAWLSATFVNVSLFLGWFTVLSPSVAAEVSKFDGYQSIICEVGASRGFCNLLKTQAAFLILAAFLLLALVVVAIHSLHGVKHHLPEWSKQAQIILGLITLGLIGWLVSACASLKLGSVPTSGDPILTLTGLYQLVFFAIIVGLLAHLLVDGKQMAGVVTFWFTVLSCFCGWSAIIFTLRRLHSSAMGGACTGYKYYCDPMSAEVAGYFLVVLAETFVAIALVFVVRDLPEDVRKSDALIDGSGSGAGYGSAHQTEG